jgi:hypothetical protein
MACRLKVSDVRLADNCSNEVEIVFEGSLSLWRAATNLDIIIIRYDTHNCLEIIAYDPFMNQEAPRMYVNLSAVVAKIDTNEFDATVLTIKEPLLKKHEDFNVAEVERKTWNILVSKYITTRIALNMEQKANGQLVIYLKSLIGDTTKTNPLASNCLDVIMTKPANLDPMQTVHLASLRASVVMACLTTFHESTGLISAHGAKAVSYLNMAKSLATFARLGHRKKASTVALGRWQKAVNKVINLEMVKKVRVVLAVVDAKREEREAREAALRENPASVVKKVMRRPVAINAESPMFDSGCAKSPATSPYEPLPTVRTSYDHDHIAAEDHLHSLPLVNTPRRGVHVPAVGKAFFTSPRAAFAASKAASNSRLERQNSSRSISIHLLNVPASSSTSSSVPFLPHLVK